MLKSNSLLLSSSSLALLVSVAALQGCGHAGTAPASSHVEGHYEGKVPADMARFAGRQAALPEYAKVSSVMVSHQLVRLYRRADFLRALLDTGLPEIMVVIPKSQGTSNASRGEVERALGAEYAQRVRFVEHTSPSTNASTVWARDWAPLLAHDVSTGAPRLLDFNYYPRRAVDDAVSTNLEGTGWERVSVPVYNEGGNFMNNARGECFMTTRVTDANANKERQDDLVLDAQGVADFYKAFAGCKSTHIFPRMPVEGTGHIDMWAKLVSDDDVLVGELALAETRGAAGGDESLVNTVRAFLDARAAEFAAAGFRVHRVPMPAPTPFVFRSYTNSLLVNGTAFVPRYGKEGGGGVEGPEGFARYEAQVEQTYGALGFKVVWVDSDSLIANGGAVHCVTMQF